MNIVIPMAGRGTRFAEKGYKDPKPFINVDGMPMIEAVVKNLDVVGTYTFICLADFWERYHQQFTSVLSRHLQRMHVVLVNSVTEGAACTILLAKQYIDNDNELILANCDQIVMDHSPVFRAVQHFRTQNADGGIMCFLANESKWSFAEVKDGKVVKVAEKDPISNLATVGIYYFKHGKDFVQSAEQMISKNIRVNNEFYTCPVFNEFIGMGKKVLPYMVNEMYGIGTPEDLDIYMRRFKK